VAIASLILGIIGFLASALPFAGLLLGLTAIILGIAGRRRLLEEGRASGMAVGGLVLGVIAVLINVAATVACFTCARSCSELNSRVLSQPVTPEEEAQGQAWAEEQSKLLQQQVLGQENQGTPGTPGTPATPLTPGVPATPGVPVTPGVPIPGVPSPGVAQAVMVNVPVSGMFSPGLPVDADNRAYMDYTLDVVAPGNYTITLISPSSAAYDPYLRLMQFGGELDSNDDGAGYPNSRISRMLTPGSYTVRVTSFRRGQIAAPAPFTLTVTNI
jgi:hypothetical protein